MCYFEYRSLNKLAKMENIFNRTPAVSEDTVQYVLYPPKEQSDKASVTTLAVLIQNHADYLLPDIQWHRDSFQLKVVPHPLGRGFILEGRMRVGDSIDDEWCTVWLLREIGTKWDVAVRYVGSPRLRYAAQERSGGFSTRTENFS